MNLALWIVASVLAASFAGSGLMKLLVPKDKLVSSGQGWAQDVTPTNIRLIGVVEVLGAAGLILPAITHIAPVLVPLAAVGLVLVMVGPAVVHTADRTIAFQERPRPSLRPEQVIVEVELCGICGSRSSRGSTTAGL